MTATPPLRTGNLHDDSAPPARGERFETLLQHRNVVVERIISSASAQPGEFVQPQDEWVLLVQGSATLEVNGVALTGKRDKPRPSGRGRIAWAPKVSLAKAR